MANNNKQPPVTRRDVRHLNQTENVEPDRYCPRCGRWYSPDTDNSHDGH